MKLLRKRRVDKAFVEQTEVPKRYDPSTNTWVDTSGYVYNTQTGLWEEKWSACPINGIYLYNKGKEYTDVTGGWRYNCYQTEVKSSNSSGSSGYKNDDNMNIHAPGAWSGSQHSGFYTLNTIDLTDYSTLKVMTYANRSYGYIFLSTKAPWFDSSRGRWRFTGPYLKKVSITISNTYQLHEIDVSDLTGEYYVHVMGSLDKSQYNLNVYISQVWLEKEEETEQVDVSNETT